MPTEGRPVAGSAPIAYGLTHVIRSPAARGPCASPPEARPPTAARRLTALDHRVTIASARLPGGGDGRGYPKREPPTRATP